MKKLLLSKNDAFKDHTKADVTAWYSIYKLINLNVSLVDRCDQIKNPYAFHNYFPMPTVPTGFDKTYKEICVERASQLLDHAKKLNKPIVILYSGGIDSTAVVISFLLATTDTSNITIALNTASITENPNFYYSHIRGRFKLLPSERTLDMLTGDCVMVGGEFNDQLFGSDIMGEYQKFAPVEQLFVPYAESNIVPFLEHAGMETAQAKQWYSLLDNHIRTQNRCEIKYVKDFFWWLNFAFKWQSVYFRIIARTARRELIDQTFLDNYYHQFYNTDDFQCWSMMNPDKKIATDWRGYKITAKELILEYTNDQEYFENKVKMGSLSGIFRLRGVPDALGINEDGTFEFVDTLDKSDYYDPDNSFVI
jgi:hypothetical protein